MSDEPRFIFARCAEEFIDAGPNPKATEHLAKLARRFQAEKADPNCITVCDDCFWLVMERLEVAPKAGHA